MKNKILTVAFTGGGTGGHIYPGLAVADALREKCAASGMEISIIWIGSLSKMDRNIVLNSGNGGGRKSADKFYGIPSGKMRRYFSLKNFIDVFKIGFGFVAAFFILLCRRPVFLFSKGGFVSVPPCVAARLLGIKVFTHECDFTPGLATRINSKFAHKVLLSYEETRGYFASGGSDKFVVTGNPVRPVFYETNPAIGLNFAGIEKAEKPILLAMGGSLGAAQINSLVFENIEFLCKNFIVLHQTGLKNTVKIPDDASEEVKKSYHAFPFVYGEMPHLIAASDIVLSRAGANSIWECAVLAKPMLLIPLEGSGTRGDQVDNAEYFEKRGAAVVLKKADLSATALQDALLSLKTKEQRKKYSDACRTLCGSERSADKIASILFNFIEKSGDKNAV